MKSGDRKDKIAVVVGTITNDLRILNLPKLKVRRHCCCLMWSSLSSSDLCSASD